MPELHDLLERRASGYGPPSDLFERVVDRRRRRDRKRRIGTAVVALAVAAVAIGGLLRAISSGQVPADDRLGVFAPLSGRIVYVNGPEAGDLGYDPGVWAVDPNGPADTAEGPSVAEDVASTLVRFRLGPGDADTVTPLAWSRDGTELLFKRTHEELFPEEFLYVLHADGSETPLNEDPLNLGGAAISPDGTRVVYAAWGDDLGLYVVDVGGRPVRLPLPAVQGIVGDPTFSPDGARIAFVDSGEAGSLLWVMDVDGANTQRILADEATLSTGGAGGLQWSPAGDLLAVQVRVPNGDNVIFTFAPDGSDFTQVIRGALSPHWSPDGSQIAYTIECEITDTSCGGLAIVDADGSNARELGFAASGPWHPGVSATDEPVPPPADAPAGSEVLSFTGTSETPGDLVAVDPATGEERVLAEGLDDVSSAKWSADRRWVAFERAASVWVVGRAREPRRVFDAEFQGDWSWSSTGARLAVFRPTESSENTLYLVDAATGQETELASLVERRGDVFSPIWSPDETKILFGVRGGTVYSVDTRTGERSVVVQLPGENLDSIDGIEWSPDGSHMVIFHNGEDLYVSNPDGSGLRALTESGALVFGFDWSPDGSRIVWTEDHGGEFHVLVAPADGSTSTLVASLPNAPSNPVWSPDRSQIALGHRNAYLSEGATNLVIDADGAGEAVPLDDLRYESWRGGSYDCDCDLFG